MTKMNYFLVATGLLLCASCADTDTNLSPSPVGSNKSDVIGFNLQANPVTRTTLSGKDAAEKLESEFVVYGTKHLTTAEDATATNDAIAFQNYKVTWKENTANTSASNSSNWEYDGETPYASAKVSPAITSTTQSIKYWDYSATQGYTFTAFAGKTLLEKATGTEDSPVIKKITSVTDNGATVYDKGYTVKLPASADLDQIYFSDRVTVAKANYGDPVTLTFRNFGARVRVGFYETVPGYSVKIDNFYVDNRDTKNSPVTKYSEMGSTETTNFVAALQNVNKAATGGNTVTVTYGNKDAANGIAENQVKINSGSSANYQYTLTLGGNLLTATALGTSSTQPTWDTEKGAYTTVYPNLENTTPMLIRCDYTLTATDGSGETIKVKNARVVVPYQYCQWKSNFAYTYLFKITDKTNGTTGSTPTDPDDPSKDDPEGLFPITFDAVAITATEYQQETVTTIATNSVTTYAKNSDVTKNGEYKVGEDIYFVNQSTSATTSNDKTTHDILPVEGMTANTAKNAVIYSIGTTAYTEADIFAQLTGSKIKGLTLSQVENSSENTGAKVSVEQYAPAASGKALDFGEKGALKFTPASAGYYAYVYCNTAYVAPQYEEASTYTAGTTYYLKANDGTNDVYYVASGITDEATFKNMTSKVYTLKTDSKGTAGAYDIKVVSVVK